MVIITQHQHEINNEQRRVSNELLRSNAEQLRYNASQLDIIAELRTLHTEQVEISRRLLRLLENVTGQSSNGSI